jgi:hypothetical protein
MLSLFVVRSVHSQGAPSAQGDKTEDSGLEERKASPPNHLRYWLVILHVKMFKLGEAMSDHVYSQASTSAGGGAHGSITYAVCGMSADRCQHDEAVGSTRATSTCYWYR